jgi:surface protein
MNSMFQNASAFNKDISSWDVWKITTTPTSFNTSANASWVANSAYQPKWGSCMVTFDAN